MSLSVPPDVWRIPKMGPEASYLEFAKYFECKNECVLQDDLAKRAFSYTVRHLAPSVRKARFRDFDQAAASVDPTGSACSPYNILYMNKAQALKEHDMRTDVRDLRNSILAGHPIPQLFMNQQKQELRKFLKAARTFMPGPFALHLLMVMLFGDMHDAMVEDFESIWIKVGISPFKRGWDRLYQELAHSGTKFIESDVSGWDRSCSAELIWWACEVYVALLPYELATDENMQLVRGVFDLMINSYVLLEGGEVVRKFSGVNSGAFGTVQINSVIHTLMVMYAFVKNEPKVTYTLIVNNARFAFMGDDDLGVIRPAAFSRMQERHLGEIYAHFGMKCKTFTVADTLDNLVFLSNRFVRRDGMWLAAPDRMKVICSLAYGNRSVRLKYLFIRLMAFRQLTWPDEALFEFVDEYTEKFYSKHKRHLMSETIDETGNPECTWDQIRGQWLSANQLKILHEVSETRAYNQVVVPKNSKATLICRAGWMPYGKLKVAKAFEKAISLKRPGKKTNKKKKKTVRKAVKKFVRKEKRVSRKRNMKKAKMHKGAMPHKPHQMWRLAASAGGWEGSYDSKKGFGLQGPGYQTVQPSATVSAMPASSSHLYKLGAKRKTLGNGDLILEGIQSVGTIGTITSSGTNEALVVGGTTRQNAISLSPDILGGQMALDARNYSYYKFLATEIIFIMNAPSTDALGVACAFSPDPAITDFQTITSTSIKTSKDYFSFTRKEMKPIVWSITRTLKDVQYAKLNTEYDSTSSASKRQTLNGILFFFFSANDTSTTTVYGDVLIKFVLKLMNREPDYGFTVSIMDNKWAKWIWDQIQQRMEGELKEHHAIWTKKKLGIDQKGENPWDASVSEVPDWPTERNNYVMKRINRYRATSRQAQYLLPVAVGAPQAYVTPLITTTNGTQYLLGSTGLSAAGVPLMASTAHAQDTFGNQMPIGISCMNDGATSNVPVLAVQPHISDNTSSGVAFPQGGVLDTTQSVAAAGVALIGGQGTFQADFTKNAVVFDGLNSAATVSVGATRSDNSVTGLRASTVGSLKTLPVTASSSTDTKAGAVESPPVIGDDGQKYVKLRIPLRGSNSIAPQTAAVGKTYAEAVKNRPQ
jgi:hypothetical protein